MVPCRIPIAISLAAVWAANAMRVSAQVRDPPVQLAGFRLLKREVFPEARLGVLYGYQGTPPLRSVIVILFPLPAIYSGSAASRDSAVGLEFAQAKGDIYTLQQRMRGPTPRVLSEVTLLIDTAPNSPPLRGRRGSYAYAIRNVPMYSHLYVFAIHHVFVKVRTMYEQAVASADPPLALQLFVEALVASVAKDST
jgi:hypothetical protein